MATASKLAPVRGKRPVTEMRSAGSPLTPELKGFIDRVTVPILVRDYLSGIAREKQLAHPREGVASCESTVMPNAESAR
jgi:hypothetical protein